MTHVVTERRSYQVVRWLSSNNRGMLT